MDLVQKAVFYVFCRKFSTDDCLFYSVEIMGY